MKCGFIYKKSRRVQVMDYLGNIIDVTCNILHHILRKFCISQNLHNWFLKFQTYKVLNIYTFVYFYVFTFVYFYLLSKNYLIANKHTGKAGFWIHGLDAWTLNSELWTLALWTRARWLLTTCRLDSGRLNPWTPLMNF